MIKKFDKLDLMFILSIIVIDCVVYFTNIYYLLQPIGILIAYALIMTLRNVFKSYIAYFLGDKEILYYKTSSLNPLRQVRKQDALFLIIFLIIRFPIIIFPQNRLNYNFKTSKNADRARILITLANFFVYILLIILSLLACKYIDLIVSDRILISKLINIFLIIFFMSLSLLLIELLPIGLSSDLSNLILFYSDIDLQRILLRLNNYYYIILFAYIYFLDRFNIFTGITKAIFSWFGIK